jgi:membrane-associated phospholipid phosphatase
MKNYVHKNPEILFLLYLPVYLVWFMLAEHFITENYYVSYMPLDDLIPFVPQFVMAYVLWYPFILLPILFLYKYDRGAYVRYCVYLIITLSVSLAVCCFFPNGQDLRPTDTGDGVFARIIDMLYAADTNTNVLPSMHVVTSLGVVMAFFDCKGLKRLRIPAVVLALFICASTVFIKQHSFLDVIWGAVLSAAAGIVVYAAPWLRKRNKIS